MVHCTTNDGVLGDYASVAPLIVDGDLSLKRARVIIDIWGAEYRSASMDCLSLCMQNAVYFWLCSPAGNTQRWLQFC